MKRLIAFILFAATLATAAVQDGQVAYLGGTLANVKEGTTGRLDTTSPAELVFEYPDGQLKIPFATIESYQYSQRLARHLGVAPTVVVALVKWPQHRHFFTIRYLDASRTPQVAIFEVSKQMPQSLQAVLAARVPAKPCGPVRQGWPGCGRLGAR